MKVFAINGISYSGKDSFVNRVLSSSYGKITSYSTIDPVKDLYAHMGWDGVKTDSARKGLNTLKRIWIDLNDGPMNFIKQKIILDSENGCTASFVMVREFEEMMKVVTWANKTFGFGQTIEVVRDGLDVPPVEQEFLDSHPADYMYNWRVYNQTTTDKLIPDLWDSACYFKRCIEREDTKNFNVLGTQFDVSYLDKRLRNVA